MVGGGGMAGGVNLDCALTSAGESGMVESFSVRSGEDTQTQTMLDDSIKVCVCVIVLYVRAARQGFFSP